MPAGPVHHRHARREGRAHPALHRRLGRRPRLRDGGLPARRDVDAQAGRSQRRRRAPGLRRAARPSLRDRLVRNGHPRRRLLRHRRALADRPGPQGGGQPRRRPDRRQGRLSRLLEGPLSLRLRPGPVLLARSRPGIQGIHPGAAREASRSRSPGRPGDRGRLHVPHVRQRPGDETPGRQDDRQPQSDHGRRHGHVRRLPLHRRGPDEVRLRRRSRFRRSPGGLGRAVHAPRNPISTTRSGRSAATKRPSSLRTRTRRIWPRTRKSWTRS